MSKITIKQNKNLESILHTPKTGFVAIGGCVDFILMDVVPKENTSPCDIHKQVAIFAMDHVRGMKGPISPEKMKGIETPYMFGEIWPKFSNPPYSLKAQRPRVEELFGKINEELFGENICRTDNDENPIVVQKDGKVKILDDEFLSTLEVYDWTGITGTGSTEWCPKYFHAGKEWWGVLYYTIKNQKGEYIVIAASTSD